MFFKRYQVSITVYLLFDCCYCYLTSVLIFFSRILKFANGPKQIILASATLCDSVSKFIEKYMNEPMRVTATGVKLLTDSENDVPKVNISVYAYL